MWICVHGTHHDDDDEEEEDSQSVKERKSLASVNVMINLGHD
jgi:hypothetical protein